MQIYSIFLKRTSFIGKICDS